VTTGPGSHAKSIAAKPSGVEQNFYSVIKTIFTNWGDENSLLDAMEPLEGKERRILCSTCCSVIRTCFLSDEKLKNQKSETSYLHNLLIERLGKMTQECQTEGSYETNEPTSSRVILTPVRRQVGRQGKQGAPAAVHSTPVGKKIQKALTVAKTRIIVQNQIALRISKEMKSFTLNSRLRNFDSEEGFIPTDQEILEELETYCPTALRAITALVNGSGDMSAPIRAIVGISSYNHSQVCNGLQKAIAFLLYSNHAPVKVRPLALL